MGVMITGSCLKCRMTQRLNEQYYCEKCSNKMIFKIEKAPLPCETKSKPERFPFVRFVQKASFRKGSSTGTIFASPTRISIEGIIWTSHEPRNEEESDFLNKVVKDLTTSIQPEEEG